MQGEENIKTRDDRTIWYDLGVLSMLEKIRLRKWLMLVIPFVWLIFSNIGFLFSGLAYSSEMLVIPAAMSGDNARGGGLSGALGGLGLGIGGITDVTDGTFSIYLETWRSSWFAEQVLKNPTLTHKIFAGEWSARDQRWIRPSGIGSVVKSLIKEIFGGTPTEWSPPSTEAMMSFMQGHIVQSNVRGEVITRISVELKDRELGEEILRFGHASINAHLAELFRTRADANVGYIMDQLNKVSVAEYREALLNTLSQVEHTRMIAFSNPEFAAIALTTYVGDTPVKPNSRNIIAISFLLALVLYFVLVVLADTLNWPVRGREVWARTKALFRR